MTPEEKIASLEQKLKIVIEILEEIIPHTDIDYEKAYYFAEKLEMLNWRK